MSVVGRGMLSGHLPPEAVEDLTAEGLGQLRLDGRRVLVIIPDGTRTMPMPLMFDAIERALERRVAALDYLVALGTHPPMGDSELSRLVGRHVADGVSGERRIFNHRWDDPSTFLHLGAIPAGDIREITHGMLNEEVPVRTKWWVSPAGRSTCFRESRRRRSFISRTGWVP
jgi:nickel-dependent lactate racemase